MSRLLFAYNSILSSAGRAVIPFVCSRSANDPAFMRGRLGFYDGVPCRKTGPRIWFHAASVGEVTGAVPTIRLLHDRLPESSIFLTVGTPQGFRFASSQLPEWVCVLPFPLDFPRVVERAFQTLRPDLYVALESEFWPNLFRLLECHRIPAVLLNGRLSKRSAKFYTLLKPLFTPIFKQFRWLAMHSDEDLRNIVGLGAPPAKTVLLGSSKYDGLSAKADPERAAMWRKILDLPEDVPVLIGGSLRRSECLDLPQVFQSLSKLDSRLVGIFVPRHLERIQNMVHWFNGRDVNFQLLTRIERGEERRTANAILVDRIGVLFELYALGDLIFCGGTLEEIGGHNILEPAAWKKPVFYGPHLKKVYHEHRILQELGGSFLSRDAQDLLRQWKHWLSNIDGLKSHGEKAGKALESLGGVAAKQVDLLMTVLSQR